MSGKRGNPNIIAVTTATRFKPGQSGNPGGKPKGLSLTRLVREELQKPTVPGSRVTKAEVIAQRIVNLAEAGDRIMIPLVWRYVDGDPKQSAEMTLRELAEQLAGRMGLDAQELLAAFERDRGGRGRRRV